MIGVKIPQAYICVLRTAYRDNIAYTWRSYKTREAHNLALNAKYRDIREFYTMYMTIITLLQYYRLWTGVSSRSPGRKMYTRYRCMICTRYLVYITGSAAAVGTYQVPLMYEYQPGTYIPEPVRACNRYPHICCFVPGTSIAFHLQCSVSHDTISDTIPGASVYHRMPTIPGTW